MILLKLHHTASTTLLHGWIKKIGCILHVKYEQRFEDVKNRPRPRTIIQERDDLTQSSPYGIHYATSFMDKVVSKVHQYPRNTLSHDKFKHRQSIDVLLFCFGDTTLCNWITCLRWYTKDYCVAGQAGTLGQAGILGFGSSSTSILH